MTAYNELEYNPLQTLHQASKMKQSLLQGEVLYNKKYEVGDTPASHFLLYRKHNLWTKSRFRQRYLCGFLVRGGEFLRYGQTLTPLSALDHPWSRSIRPSMAKPASRACDGCGAKSRSGNPHPSPQPLKKPRVFLLCFGRGSAMICGNKILCKSLGRKGLNMVEKRIHCLTCKYYYITWDQKYPYGCKAMGFKSNTMPCLDTLRLSGQRCCSYENKTER
jgi:hypothetical protein